LIFYMRDDIAMRHEMKYKRQVVDIIRKHEYDPDKIFSEVNFGQV
jgi:hypothetical protein